MGNMLKNNSTLKKLEMVCLLFLHVLKEAQGIESTQILTYGQGEQFIEYVPQQLESFRCARFQGGPTKVFMLRFCKFFLKLINKPPSGSFPPLKQCPDL